MDYITIGIIAWATVATTVCFITLKALFGMGRAIGAHMG